MTRRSIIRLFAAAPVLALDPEKLLWTPGKKLVSIPPVVRGRNRIIPPEEFAHMIYVELIQHIKLESLEDKVKYAHMVDARHLARLKVGDTISVRIPPPFLRFPFRSPSRG